MLMLKASTIITVPEPTQNWTVRQPVPFYLLQEDKSMPCPASDSGEKKTNRQVKKI